MKTGKAIAASLLRVLIAIVSGIILLCLVYCIPTFSIEKNVRDSAIHTIKEEGLYPEIIHMATSYLDNWTDSIMLAEAAHPNGESVLDDAMQVRRYVAHEFPDQSLVIWAETGEYIYETSYPQYWHGYLVFLKPLLTVTNLSGIRVINAAAQIILTLAVAVILWKTDKKGFVLPWLIGIAMLMPAAMAKCMQFSSCFYIFTITTIAVLSNKKSENLYLVFLWAGIATAYFDFLTYPISTFGVPAVFYLIRQQNTDIRKILKQLLLFLLVWAAGYGLMWGGKILFGGLLTGNNFIREAGNHMGYWLDGERWYTVSQVFYLNVRDFAYTPVTLIGVGFVFVTAVSLLCHKRIDRKGISAGIPYLIVAVLPFLWYLFLFNPSGTHHFFTNKACVVTAISLMSMVVTIFQTCPDKDVDKKSD